jgi:hypothetical protein
VVRSRAGGDFLDDRACGVTPSRRGK